MIDGKGIEQKEDDCMGRKGTWEGKRRRKGEEYSIR
jgi:hypothetical protein